MSPRAFTETEKLVVRENLIQAATRYLSTTGIRKTSVEELAKAVNISKGAFYSFYESKELLFLDALEREQQKLHDAVIEGILGDRDRRRGFVTAIGRVYRDFVAKPWLLGFTPQDYGALLRRIPMDRIRRHIELDDDSARRMRDALGEGIHIEPELLSAALRMLFFGVLHRGEVGENLTDAAFELLIEALADRLFGEQHDPR